jgi:transposase
MSSLPSPSAPSSVTAFVRLLLPEALALQLIHISVAPERVAVTAASISVEAACPSCAQPSQRIQSRYTRTLADLSLLQRPVQLLLQVRRFVCGNLACAQKIFTERLPDLVQPYARRTARLRQQQSLIAFALGGEGGAKLCHRLGFAISPDTLLADVRRQSLPAHPTPRVLGVDDCSFRRGRQMGTILVDLERHCPVDLLADCSEESFAAWLAQHPGVEVISRDRGEVYAAGGRRGAPAARHVADRWHLLKNLGDAVQKLMSRHTATLRQAASQLPRNLTSQTGASPALSSPLKPRRRRSPPLLPSAQRQRQLEMYAQVQTLINQGWTVAAIVDQLKLNRQTVRKYRDMESFRDQRTTFRVSTAEPYRAYLEQRWAEGCTEAKQLWLELKAQGYQGRYKSVWQFTRYWELPQALAAPQPLPAPTALVRTPRQAMWAPDATR